MGGYPGPFSPEGNRCPENRQIFAYFHIEKHRPTGLYGERVWKRVVPRTRETVSALKSLTGSRP